MCVTSRLSLVYNSLNVTLQKYGIVSAKCNYCPFCFIKCQDITGSLLIFPPEDRHGLSRKDQFAISCFSTSLIVLRSGSITGSTTGRSGTTHWFDAGDLLIFLYLTTTTRQLEILEKSLFCFLFFFSISVKLRPEIMFNDVLNTKKSKFIKGVNR